jgi:glycosyltransferase involved in cell wall biosynthesis
MKAVDVLLMPYQQSVSIGVRGHDTARWMSPMKMFEYLASGTPVVSSDLTVLREVLRNGENALLVSPTAVDQWTTAVDRLLGDQAFAQQLGRAGHATYASGYTWTTRAQRILEAAA